MRLKDKNTSPVGGWYYIYTDSKGTEYKVENYSGSFHSLVAMVRTHMARNNVLPPEDLESYVEDQICSRQPADRCWYQKSLGDQISKTIHTFAAGVDRVSKAIGVNSNLEKKARGCRTCGQRRMKLNGA